MLLKLITPAILQGKEEYIEIEIGDNQNFNQQDVEAINSQLIKRQDMVRLFKSISINECDYEDITEKKNLEDIVEIYKIAGWHTRYYTPSFFETGHAGALFCKP